MTGGPAHKSKPLYANINGFCGDSYEHGIYLWAAVKREDSDGVAGMLSRGDAFQLKKGVEVSLVATRGSMSAALVDSGFNMGKTCWAPAKMFSETGE